jgi:ubiquinone/menaquinone biosynthesis C-methylase UbiE
MANGVLRVSNASARSTRKCRWVSALDPRYHGALLQLEDRLRNYYSSSRSYYDDVDFTADNWVSNPIHRYVARVALESQTILEVGCGRSNIIRHYPELECRYSGTDFSVELMRANSSVFPKSTFVPLTSASELPFPSGAFECVFSTFVLEHCVFPHRMLDECLRVAAPNGRIILVCPEFLSRGWIPSQRIGFGPGTGREKARRGALVDAALTALDSRVRMKLMARRLRREAAVSPKFYVNLFPTCFSDPFQPDVDAVYLVFESEVRRWLCKASLPTRLPAQLERFAKERYIVLIDVRKG